MKRSTNSPLWLLMMGLTAGACSSGTVDRGESIGEASAPITLPGLAPVPKGWDGSMVDLMVADALSSCSWQTTTQALDMGTARDAYIAAVIGHMQTAACGSYADANNSTLLGHWYLQRKDPACNDPGDAGGATSITLNKHVVPQKVTTATAGVPAGIPQATYDAANALLRAPSVNLCVAQQLREQAPGTAGGQALLLSSAEQRLLLEVTRERAQQAMLGFAQLAVAFTEADPGNPTTPANLQSTTPLPLVIKWGRDPANGTGDTSVLAGMGRDFAAAVQLEAIAAQQIAELFGRSSAAGEPRGGHAATLPEETWSAGSWRQRSLASLFGGDPLADEADGSAPWTNPVGNHQPNVTVGGYGALPWLDKWAEPYFQVDMSRPEVERLLALARQYDVLDVKSAGSFVDGNCIGVDRAATTTQVYKAVEVAIRNATCFQQAGSSCVPVTIGSLPDPSVDYSQYLVWRMHGVTPEHASISAEYIAQLLEPFCGAAGTMHSGSGARTLSQGSIWASALGSGWYHISSNALFVERSPMDIQPLYGQYTHFWMVDLLRPWANAQHQGFSPWNGSVNFAANTAEESRRLLGSSAALIATREALIVADSRLNGMYSPPPHVGPTYFAEQAKIFDVIGGAVGNVGVTIRPVLTSTANSGANLNAGMTVAQSGANYLWMVDVTMPVDHPWWTANGTYNIVAVPNDPVAASLVQYNQTSILGRTAASVIGAPTTIYGTVSTKWTTTTLPNNLRSFRGTIYLPSGIKNVTFIGKTGAQYAVLASNVPISPSDASSGYYMSPLGSLGLYGDRLLRGQAGNPSKPAYDGFGFATNWVPPTDPSLFGGALGEDAASHYLSRAKEAAISATQAVQQAFDNMLQQQTDAAAAQAANAMSAAVVQQQADALCGPGNASCNTKVSATQVVPIAFSPSCSPMPNPDTNPSGLVDCIAASMLSVAKSNFLVADVVQQTLNQPTVPAFAAYGGGSLQGLFIDQWGDVQQLRDAVSETLNAKDEAQKHVTAFQTAMASASAEVKINCSTQRMDEASNAGKSMSVGASVSSGFASATASVSVTASFSDGPLIAQRQKCEDLMAALPSQQANLIAGLWDSFSAMAAHAARVHEAATTLAKSGAAIQYELELARQAQAQALLEAELLQKTQTTSFGLYRRYHSYDLWRAQASLEDARRFAVAARRAIEAKYLVDLSTMEAPEAFVAAPASWADQVYDYDLSLPAAVGLSVGTQSASGIYPSKILDYVGNLERFVEGYAVNRPSASAQGDSDVITLLGPETSLVDPQAGGYGANESQQNAWSFYCASGASGQWVGLPTSGPFAGKADAACAAGAKPSRARLVFSLDPWGRVNANAVEAPLSKRYNARWSKLAVNVVGTGIKDCTQATDPLGCYSSAFINYDLSHIGPSWVTDYAGAWRTLGVPIGQIEQAKALTAEQWLDPITNGWSAPYVQAVGRWELTDRPLDGAYMLELEVAPEVQLGHIDRVQVLSSTSYWVKQQ